MKRKKQGASLIVVIILFMFISTVSMAMLSMVASNYKARVAESKRVENLYASDSGIDVAYNIIGKTFDAAAKYAHYEVYALNSTNGNSQSPNDAKYKVLIGEITNLNANIVTLNVAIQGFKAEIASPPSRTQKNINDDIADAKATIEEDKSLIEEDENLKQVLLNEEFKRTFKNFIAAPASTSELGTGETSPDKLGDSIVNHNYVSKVNFNNTNNTFIFDVENIDFGIKDNKSPELTVVVKPKKVSETSIDEIVVINDKHLPEVKTLQISKSVDKYEDIVVTSTFYTQKVNGNNTNERQLQANFKMLVPNYKDVYFQKATGELEEYLSLKDRALTVYGNMNINDPNYLTSSSGLIVDGEIFVEGRETTTTTTNRAFEKYNGGITISNSKNVTFNDDVITRHTFNVRDNAYVTIGGNLYGRNVYMGGKYYDNYIAHSDALNEPASGSTLNVNNESITADKGRIVIDNDLALKANNSTINIKDFYGINDRTIQNTPDKVKTASSIIVNAYDDRSKINIEKSAYIMGAAHINVNEGTDGSNRYQTGESGAVKGNYIAYAVRLSPDESFVYHDPLQLLEGTILEKANHFAAYWNGEIASGHDPDAGGINWPRKDGHINTGNIVSAGAIVCDDIDGNGTKEVKSSIINNDALFQVYDKQAEFAKKVYQFNQPATKPAEYDKTIVAEFNTLIDTAKITSPILDQTNEGGYAIFNGSENTEIKITTSNDAYDHIVTNVPNIINIQVADKGIGYGHTLNAVIATAGNVSIGSDITLKGSLITQGDLNISGDNVNIKYDSGVIDRVQANNVDTFKSVFGGSLLVDDNTTTSTTIDINADANYDLKNFLENKLWKILK